MHHIEVGIICAHIYDKECGFSCFFFLSHNNALNALTVAPTSVYDGVINSFSFAVCLVQFRYNICFQKK